MMSDRPASRIRSFSRPLGSPLGRPLGRPAALGLLLALGPAAPAAAQEALVLRIRPQPDPVEAARAAREAVWARSQARARAAIASVCTGCLAPWQPPEAAIKLRELAPEGRVAALAEPAPRPPTGLEPDPDLGASEPTAEPPSRERHP